MRSAEDIGSPVLEDQILKADRHRRLRRVIILSVIVVAAIGFLLYKGLGSALDYYETVNQAVAARSQLGSSTFRMEGKVVPGSIHPFRGGVDFIIEHGGVSERVVQEGAPPQLFQPSIDVVVVGHFQGNYFLSNRLMVKHSAYYIPEKSTSRQASGKLR
ncbi:MAG: cytochrome c maturation protein CcmE [Actinobacteria bacterium]|jgi:cytochrome c-type biogenesis protein CcmE|nr:cytochrome c maturation protein CcmE [Actinomycetota bacterium]MCL6094482.1 cytochrome c maturation protein CcmE [Actinomycetota bacterium]